MQPNANAEADRAPELIPELKHTVPWRVTSVNALSDADLYVTFVDGTAGDVRMKSFLTSPTVDGTVFESLRDPAIFAQAKVVMGAVQWPNGAELAPDAMYDAIREHGVWILD
ncbi:MAG: DUF2442 domain-containing protein [Alphaproteobacteria bacterium]